MIIDQYLGKTLKGKQKKIRRREFRHVMRQKKIDTFQKT